MSFYDDYDYLLKIIVVGDGAVGKTALSVRFTQGKFQDDYKMTIGVDFAVKMMDVDGKRIKCQIWDTGGQERFSYLRPLYYSGAVGGLVVFDKTYRPSFNNIPKWFQEVRDNRGPDIPLVLCGNKVDLPDWQVDTQEAVNLGRSYKAPYHDVSAKSGQSVDDAFVTLVKMVIDPGVARTILEEKTTRDVAEQSIVMSESYNKYNSFANQATAYLEAGNVIEALNSLKKSLYWARDVQFEPGIKWCEDQIAYIQKFLKQEKEAQQVQRVSEFIYRCPGCNVYFKVNQVGQYTCPDCGSVLERI
ncbi:MAG: GTP-binding protein [Candidatus Helarchaeota archaeon]